MIPFPLFTHIVFYVLYAVHYHSLSLSSPHHQVLRLVSLRIRHAFFLLDLLDRLFSFVYPIFIMYFVIDYWSTQQSFHIGLSSAKRICGFLFSLLVFLLSIFPTQWTVIDCSLLPCHLLFLLAIHTVVSAHTTQPVCVCSPSLPLLLPLPSLQIASSDGHLTLPD